MCRWSARARKNPELADRLLASLRHVPGLADLRLGQVFNLPELDVQTDRTRAEQLGITPVGQWPTICCSRSRAAARSSPTFWLNPQNGISYPVSWRRRRSTS